LEFQLFGYKALVSFLVPPLVYLVHQLNKI
jgi:hypothetical protein